MKTCSKCKISKTESEFRLRNKKRNIYHSQCKDCSNHATYLFDECQCGKQKRSVSKLCNECRRMERTELSNYENLTMGDKTYNHLKCAKYSYIRYYARKIGKELGFNCCKKCGYNKHFEICHIKPIHTFDKNTLLTVINEPSNLTALCPNCHWEFDNGLLKL